jgi:uncharacterized protein
MLIQDMTREMSEDLLKRTHVGRLGCAQGSQPYVVPISFAYHREFIYSFATIGKKIEWMRANPLVCVEADEIVSRHKWQTVVIFGRFQELPDTPEFHRTRMVAHDILAKTAMWWSLATSRRCIRAKNGRSSQYIFGFRSARFPAIKGFPSVSALTGSTRQRCRLW